MFSDKCSKDLYIISNNNGSSKLNTNKSKVLMTSITFDLLFNIYVVLKNQKYLEFI